MPLHDVLENTFATSLYYVSMARNDPLKVPFVDSFHAFCKICPVLGNAMPDQPLLPVTLRIGDGTEDLGEDPASSTLARLAVLFR